MKYFWTEENQQKYLQIISTGYKDIAKIGMIFPEEIIDKIFEYEHFYEGTFAYVQICT